MALTINEKKRMKSYYNGISGLQTGVTGINMTMEWLTRKPKHNLLLVKVLQLPCTMLITQGEVNTVPRTHFSSNAVICSNVTFIIDSVCIKSEEIELFESTGCQTCSPGGPEPGPFWLI